MCDKALSIGITTFKRRYKLVESLVKQIRGFDQDINILITVNADYKETFDEKYRQNILNLAANTPNCFPIVFPTFTSLSKMWNTLIINSPTEYTLVLNDDLKFDNETIIPGIQEYIQNIKKSRDELFLVNNSWSHFVISKKIAHKLNYFDERLLAFCEEDGDMVHRYIRAFGEKPHNLEIDGISNMYEGYQIAPSNMEIQTVGTRFTPKFNRNWLFSKKYIKFPVGIKGLFDYRVLQILSDKQQYPYEEFKREHFDEI